MYQRSRLRRLTLGVSLFVLVLLCLLSRPVLAWADDYVQRENGRIYTVINTVRLENRSSRSIHNINVEVPLASDQSVHWQDVLGEELSPQPERIEQAADGSRMAYYTIAELAPGQTLDLVQRVAVQNYCVSYDVSSLDAKVPLNDFAAYLAPSEEISADAPEIISFAKSATSASANPYLQARLLF